jgi:hypothetical protein
MINRCASTAAGIKRIISAQLESYAPPQSFAPLSKYQSALHLLSITKMIMKYSFPLHFLVLLALLLF